MRTLNVLHYHILLYKQYNYFKLTKQILIEFIYRYLLREKITVDILKAYGGITTNVKS